MAKVGYARMWHINFLFIRINRRWSDCFYVFIAGSQGFASEQDVKRFALVIGNKNYVTAPLKNSVNDANDIADSLTEMGFWVSLLKDSNLLDLTDNVQQFYSDVKRDAHKNKLALIYYAGHAIQVNHQNYIVPLGMQFESYPQFISSLYKIDS